jgi:hypothetical protein
MQHFSLTDWADFVREVAPPEQRGEMKQHLDSGCQDCTKTAEIWNIVMDFAQQEKLNDPPSSALRIVQAYYGLIQQSALAPEGIEIAKLAFDSFQHELAGERGTVTQMPRQLLFKCGTFCVDVRLEPKPGSNYVVMVGQVIDAKKPLKGFDHVPVSLLSRGDKVSETTTNQFGEFHFGFESVQHMQLFFGMQQKALVVPLPQGQTVAA